MKIDTVSGIWEVCLLTGTLVMFLQSSYFWFGREKKFFFEHVCTHEWNENQDAGYPLTKTADELMAEFPDWEKAIRDFMAGGKKCSAGR